jgi:hypothetical protein
MIQLYFFGPNIWNANGLFEGYFFIVIMPTILQNCFFFIFHLWNLEPLQLHIFCNC